MGLKIFVNGELLKVAEKAGFDVLLTTDKNMASQQNSSACQQNRGNKGVRHKSGIAGVRVGPGFQPAAGLLPGVSRQPKQRAG